MGMERGREKGRERKREKRREREKNGNSEEKDREERLETMDNESRAVEGNVLDLLLVTLITHPEHPVARFHCMLINSSRRVKSRL